MVLTDRNSRAAASLLERPAAARIATCSSCGVSSSIALLAARSQLPLGALDPRHAAHALEERERGTQLRAGVYAAPGAPQPFSVAEAASRLLEPHVEPRE